MDGSAEAKKVKDRILALHEQRKNVCLRRRFSLTRASRVTWCTGIQEVSQWEADYRRLHHELAATKQLVKDFEAANATSPKS